MLKKYYDTAVMGATFLGLSTALNLENVVVIESGGLFGAEFINSYKICDTKPMVPKSKLGNDFLCKLRTRGLSSDNGEIYQAPTIYVLSEYLKERTIDILLMTITTEVKKLNGYYYITVYHTKGFETIVAKHLIDTTTLGIMHEKVKTVDISKSLNAVIYNPKKNQMDGLTLNELSGLFTYSLPVSFDICRYDAIEALCSMESIFIENNMRISSIAPEFSYTMHPCNEVIDDNFIWNPSVSYANLVEAFDEGCSCYRKGEIK